jgi:hypothetical protein
MKPKRRFAFTIDIWDGRRRRRHQACGVINVTGMIGVLAGTILFTFAIVLLLFRRGFGFDIPNSFHWFW